MFYVVFYHNSYYHYHFKHHYCFLTSILPIDSDAVFWAFDWIFISLSRQSEEGPGYVTSLNVLVECRGPVATETLLSWRPHIYCLWRCACVCVCVRERKFCCVYACVCSFDKCSYCSPQRLLCHRWDKRDIRMFFKSIRTALCPSWTSVVRCLALMTYGVKSECFRRRPPAIPFPHVRQTNIPQPLQDKKNYRHVCKTPSSEQLLSIF